MADSIKIDTAKAVELARSIAREKIKMADAFEEAKSTVTELCDFWESKVSSKTLASFNSVQKNNATPFYNHLNDYVNYIITTVAPGYVSTENTNKELGSFENLFK